MHTTPAGPHARWHHRCRVYAPDLIARYVTGNYSCLDQLLALDLSPVVTIYIGWQYVAPIIWSYS